MPLVPKAFGGAPPIWSPAIDISVSPDIGVAWDEYTARVDDTYWAWATRYRTFTWMEFTHWWVARRWLTPRDVRKR